ncbi:zinc-ribbon domain-containing protein [Shimia ponticola]|uniref:zinc-ribbon domain-containing protein n=1 Tax=Shimia ponticola TaxID=2582893 RepID=UPI0011BE78F0|nr:zinc-ribbon domain-containing protein [Shimia ponticola]
MRLICPNCDAEYEVPDSAIPQEGRDVQCSNCGHTWFFDPSQPVEPEPPVEEDDPAPVDAPEVSGDYDAVAQEDEPAPVAPRRPPPRPKRTPNPTFTPPSEAPPDYPVEDAEARPKSDPAPSAAEPEHKPAAKRRELQPEVAEVLRQEAEFEATARAREAGLEVQGDLGLDAPIAPPPPVVEDVATTGDKAARRDLLPDIDEINSTLRAAGDRDAPVASSAETEADAQTQRKGFRFGFGLTLLVMVGLAALYAYAPQVANYLPGIEPQLEQYTQVVNDLRVWLAQTVERGVAAIQDLTEGSV